PPPCGACSTCVAPACPVAEVSSGIAAVIAGKTTISSVARRRRRGERARGMLLFRELPRICVHGLEDGGARCRGALKAPAFSPGPLEVLVDPEEVLDLTQIMRRNVAQIVYALRVRVADGGGQDLFVCRATIDQVKETHRADL